MNRGEYSAVILAGGQGKRIGGCNKARLKVGGKSFLDRLSKQLEGFGDLILSTNDPSLAAGTNYRPVQDMIPRQGPLAGICAAMRASKYRHLFVIACDMPCFNGELANWLIDQYNGEDVLICRTPDGRLHPLCGIYTKDCLPVLEHNLMLGRLKIGQLLEEINCRIVDAPSELVPQFVNINTLEDFAKLNPCCTEKDHNTDIVVYCFTAYSGTGKTTFLEKLIKQLKKKGLRVGMIKHDAHDFEIDKEGKDSWRFSKAGADVVAVASGTKAAFIEQRQLNLKDIISRIHDVDIILTEGYKISNYPILLIYREASGNSYAMDPDQCLAVISDVPVATSKPVLDINDINSVAEFILSDKALRQNKEC